MCFDGSLTALNPLSVVDVLAGRLFTRIAPRLNCSDTILNQNKTQDKAHLTNSIYNKQQNTAVLYNIIMKQSMERESSWAKLDILESPNTSPSNKRGNMKALPTLDENKSTKSMGSLPKMDDEISGFPSSQVTPTPSESASKKGRREHMQKMSSWACLGFDDLDSLCA